VLERVVEIFYSFLKYVYVVGAIFFTKKILYMCQNHIFSSKKSENKNFKFKKKKKSESSFTPGNALRPSHL
jgi:hypothetical protein